MTGHVEPQFKASSFIPKDIAVERRDDGSILMSCRIPLNLDHPHLLAYLRHRSEERPDAIWISEPDRATETWRSITFVEARQQVDSLVQALLNLNLAKGSSLIILSGNSIEHAMISFAAYQLGIQIVPLTPAYSLQPGAAEQLKDRVSRVTPGLVFVQDAYEYGRALELVAQGVPVIAVDNARREAGDIEFAKLLSTQATQAVEDAYNDIDPYAPARLMFTSGSSGSPKAVIQTQRNIQVAVESNLTAFGQKANSRGVRRLDWMPWSHVTGSAVLTATLISGGTFYIDDGRPLGEEFKRTLDNLRHVSPTNYFSMPAGYVMLADALEQDPDLAKAFFSNLLTMGYGGARLPDDVARRLQALAVQHTGYKVPFTCGYGSTETGPGGCLVYWPTERVGLLGLPQPGFEVKLVPIDEDRYEVRLRSEAITPGYLGMPKETAAMLDEEGFFRMGDAATFVDPADPLAGIAFAGRISEEFKLVTGTFVRASELLDLLMLATAPLTQHIVLCGEGEEFIGLLVWLNINAARAHLGLPDATLPELNRHPEIRRQIAQSISEYNRENPSSSRRIKRFCLLDEMPSADAGELADKGSIRAGNVRKLRADVVAALFKAVPPSDVISVDEEVTKLPA